VISENGRRVGKVGEVGEKGMVEVERERGSERWDRESVKERDW
jgi:hypothetical protein